MEGPATAMPAYCPRCGADQTMVISADHFGCGHCGAVWPAEPPLVAPDHVPESRTAPDPAIFGPRLPTEPELSPRERYQTGPRLDEPTARP